MSTAYTVRENTDARRFEIYDGSALIGLAEYLKSAEKISFTHTEVSPDYEGKGVGSQLIKTALDTVRAEGGYQVRPLCPFVRSYIEKHPEYKDLLS
ncbi:GNAT family N-acetyltransferase [Arcanobacterium hippocoleae]